MSPVTGFVWQLHPETKPFLTTLLQGSYASESRAPNIRTTHGATLSRKF